jgi:CO/xanthine dehydrogenase Mo-binding subunit
MANANLDEAALKAAIAKAKEAAAIANAIEPRAKSAYYDSDGDRIVINLKSGATFSFPTEIAQCLAGASPEDLAEVEITPSGDGLHWEKLDADFSVPALLAGVFGTKAWMEQIKLKQTSDAR